MATLSEARLETLLKPYLGDAPVPPALYAQLSIYLDVLLKWNARTNLTAIRDPEQIVQRHFGESLFSGTVLKPLLSPCATVLDYGSGAGFPGLPIQLLRPDLAVVLAESQGKKASFLREAIRILGLKTEVWAARVDTMPPPRQFTAVTLRAVDNMQQALVDARARVAPGGWLASLTTERTPESTCIPLPGNAPGWLSLTQIV
jgi:16S rRNA (guanine527-N7)-methyltransferase